MKKKRDLVAFFKEKLKEYKTLSKWIAWNREIENQSQFKFGQNSIFEKFNMPLCLITTEDNESNQIDMMYEGPVLKHKLSIKTTK